MSERVFTIRFGRYRDFSLWSFKVGRRPDWGVVIQMGRLWLMAGMVPRWLVTALDRDTSGDTATTRSEGQ